jgi:hypothetical protein
MTLSSRSAATYNVNLVLSLAFSFFSLVLSLMCCGFEPCFPAVRGLLRLYILHASLGQRNTVVHTRSCVRLALRADDARSLFSLQYACPRLPLLSRHGRARGEGGGDRDATDAGAGQDMRTEVRSGTRSVFCPESRPSLITSPPWTRPHLASRPYLLWCRHSMLWSRTAAVSPAGPGILLRASRSPCVPPSVHMGLPLLGPILVMKDEGYRAPVGSGPGPVGPVRPAQCFRRHRAPGRALVTALRPQRLPVTGRSRSCLVHRRRTPRHDVWMANG